MSTLKRTTLFPLYERYGAKLVDFGGWELPVQYASGIQKEHEAVRTAAGLFDVSHMGEIRVTGPQALDYVQGIVTNDAAKLADGQAMYAFLCYPDGGVVDDLLVYRLAADDYLLVVNAANIAKDVDWLMHHVDVDGVTIRDESEETGLLALQGPLAAKVLGNVTEAPVGELGAFHFWRDVQIGEVTARVVSRTGYTGEDGFEIFVAAADAPVLWEALLAAGAEDGLAPVGLGARDTLRFEARLPLYGQELSSTITPLEAGLGIFVKLDKGDFIGREALAAQKEAGVPRRLVGIEMIERGIPRAHYPVYDGADGEPIGEVTTGTQSPTFKTNVGLALVKSDFAALGTNVWVEIRGKRL